MSGDRILGEYEFHGLSVDVEQVKPGLVYLRNEFGGNFYSSQGSNELLVNMLGVKIGEPDQDLAKLLKVLCLQPGFDLNNDGSAHFSTGGPQDIQLEVLSLAVSLRTGINGLNLKVFPESPFQRRKG